MKLFTAEEMHVLIELEIILLGQSASHGGIKKVWSVCRVGFICSQNIESIGFDLFPKEAFNQYRNLAI